MTAAPAFAAEQKPQAPAGPAAKVDPEADRILRQMSDFLAKQREFSVQTNGELQVVLDTGQKIEINRVGKVSVQRPDRLRVDRSADLAKGQLYYDGRQLTVYGERNNAYATTQAPPTLDAAIEWAMDDLGLDAPGGDLLVSNPYAALMEDVRSGTYLGRTVIGDVTAHHLAFRNREGVDWEIWVTDGPQPLPLKYVVTSRDEQGSPQYSVIMSDWSLSPRLSQEEFRFTPPRDAMRVSFLDASSLAEKQKKGGQKQGAQKQETQGENAQPEGGAR